MLLPGWDLRHVDFAQPGPRPAAKEPNVVGNLVQADGNGLELAAGFNDAVQRGLGLEVISGFPDGYAGHFRQPSAGAAGRFGMGC